MSATKLAQSDVSSNEVLLGSRVIEPPIESDSTSRRPCGCEFCIKPGAANALHFCGSNCQFLAMIDANLQSVIAIWERLPEAIRNAITALARSQEGSEQ